MKTIAALKEKKLSLSPVAMIGLLLFLFVTGTFFIHQSLHNAPLGLDFFSFWNSGKFFVFDQQSPYDENVTIASQMGIYGRPAQGAEDQFRYVYPLYNLLPILPFLLVDFPWASAAWITLNLILLMATLIHLKAPLWVLATVPFLYPFTFCIFLGNYPVIFAVILWQVYAFLEKQTPHPDKKGILFQILIGVALAWSTSKPQFMWLHLIVIGFFIFQKRLWPILVSFFVSLSAMICIPLIWLPDWPKQWLVQLMRYPEYHSTYLGVEATHVLDLFFPHSIAFPASIIAILVCLALLYWLLLLWRRGLTSTPLILGWIGITSYLMEPYAYASPQVNFWIGVILWLSFAPQKSWKVAAFWLFNVAFSWLTYWISMTFQWEPASRDLPILLVLGWWIWLTVKQARKPSAPPAHRFSPGMIERFMPSA
jgi:hypothetical protein